MVGKYGGAVGPVICTVELLHEIVTVKNIVAKYQGAGVVANKALADHESLGQAIWLGLYRVFNAHAPLRAVAE